MTRLNFREKVKGNFITKGKRHRKGLFFVLISIATFVIMVKQGKQFKRSNSIQSTQQSCNPKPAIRPLKAREEIADILEELGFKTGVEVGVKEGAFALHNLNKWKSCESYKLVDLWKQQVNYKDIANVDNQKQEIFMKTTEKTLEPFKDIVEYYKMYSVEAAKQMKKESLDFAYIDARHDYCGVMEDIKAYWPLIKPGGIMAGHDYNSNDEIRGQDWGLCMDGTRNESAVKGAVNEFFLPKGITVSVTYYREQNFMSWIVRKPLC